MQTSKLKALEQKYIMQTYGRFDLAVSYGKGCYVFDKTGKKYLDFVGGIATCSVGHGNRDVARAIAEQAGKLLNITNLYYTEPQVELAEKLVNLSGLAKCFLCNSGTEANEAAIKLAIKITGKHKMVAFTGAFHGRTLGSLAATYKDSYRQKYMPLQPEIVHVPFNDAKALEKAIDGRTAGVLIEPVQGEAGIIVPEAGFIEAVERICRKKKVLMIADEVQSGTGRTGRFFAYQHFGVQPDIVTLAKGIANGVPMGVCIARKGLEFGRGDHASTFGGNSLACAAANATIDYILKERLMQNASNMGGSFMKELGRLKGIKKVRGMGFMIAAVLDGNRKAKDVAVTALGRGLLLNNVAEDTIRFLPPLIAGRREIDLCLKILEQVL